MNLKSVLMVLILHYIHLTSGSNENLGPPGGGSPAGTHTPTSPDYGFSFVETGTPVAGDILYSRTNQETVLH